MVEHVQQAGDETAGRRTTIIDGAAIVLIVAVAAASVWRARHGMPDDVYIFLRYARRLADGDGWAFNPGGDGANGATSPLWVLLLAASSKVHADLVANAVAMYGVGLAGAGAITYRSLRRLDMPLVGLGAGLLLVANPVLLDVVGMETGLMLLLVAVVVHQAVLRRPGVAAGVAGGLLILARPDGALLIAAVLAMVVWRTRRVPWRMAVGGLVTLVPWCIYSILQFGTPVAGTLSAKSAQGRSGFFGPSFVFLRYGRTIVQHPWSLTLLLLSLIGVVLAFWTRRSRDFAVVLVIYGAAHLALYGIVIRPPAYLWYYAPEYYLMSIFSLVAVHQIAVIVLPRALPSARPLGALVAVTVVACVLVGLELREPAPTDRYGGYRVAASWLGEHAPAGADVAATEIGVLGWELDRPIVDFLGLLDDRAATDLGRSDLAAWIGREQPDFYVQHLPVWEMEEPSSGVAWFGAAYRPVFETTAPGWSRVRVYERVATKEEAQSRPRPTLVTWTVTTALTRAGADIGEPERTALQSLLERYVGSHDLQKRFEIEGGVDLGALLRLGAEGGVDDLDGPTRDVLRRLVSDGRGVVMPLAPTG